MGEPAKAFKEAVSAFPLRAYALGVLAVALLVPEALLTDSWWALALAALGAFVGALAGWMLVRDGRRA